MVLQGGNIWLGVTNIAHSREDIYYRHRFADEVQLQLKGRRTLATQRGTVHIKPGDFLTVPKGCSFANITNEECTVHMLSSSCATQQSRSNLLAKGNVCFTIIDGKFERGPENLERGRRRSEACTHGNQRRCRLELASLLRQSIDAPSIQVPVHCKFSSRSNMLLLSVFP